jgi:hypothetical protein
MELNVVSVPAMNKSRHTAIQQRSGNNLRQSVTEMTVGHSQIHEKRNISI